MRLYVLLLVLLYSFQLISQENKYKINAEFDIENKKILINQSLIFFNNSNKKLDYIILNDWSNSYSSSKSNLGKRLSEEYSLSFQRSTKKQRGFTIINKIYIDGQNFDYTRLDENIDLIKIKLSKTLNKGDSITLNINYEVIIPDDSFTGYGINKSNDINIRDWYFTFSKIENEKWIKESNLDLNDLSIDPSYFEFNLFN